MEIIGLGLFILFLLFLLLGLSQFIGMGWAAFLFDLFGQTVTGDYAELQKVHPTPKSKKRKLLGVILLVLATLCIFTALQIK